MRRVIAIAVTGLSLAGCSTYSLDSFKATPVQVQLESVPSGAEATTSLGPSCKTPCTANVPALDAGFTVTFTLPKFQPVTVPVQVIRTPGDFTNPASVTTEPNPVFAELKPAGPPPKASKPMPPKKPKPPKAATAPASGASPFPNPAPAAQPATR